MAAPRTRFPSASAVFLILSLLGLVVGAILRWGAHAPDAAHAATANRARTRAMAPTMAPWLLHAP